MEIHFYQFLYYTVQANCLLKGREIPYFHTGKICI
nr:MAG TPA: hypothetical protein [Caudoviricetes sp.]